MFDNDRVAQTAEAILVFRRSRDALFPDRLFSEPGWVCMLEVFVADANGRRISARDVAARNRMGRETTIRWVRHLRRLDLIVADDLTQMDDPLSLSAQGFERMETLVRQAGHWPPAGSGDPLQ